MTRQRSFVTSLNNAVNGFLHVLKTERNMRIHFLVGAAVLLFGVLLGVTRLEWILLCIAICFVFITEMINTVIEETVDMIEEEIHPQVRIIKDAAAGAVLVAVACALFVGFFVFSRYWRWPLEALVFRLRHANEYLLMLSVVMVVFLVILWKSFLHRGTPFRGGPVSGHAAVAGAVWCAVLFTTDSPFVQAATFLLAFLVAQGRLRGKVHSVPEILAGAVSGFLLTALLFRVLG
jgi:diacylglycerol kinase (ATP)